MDITITNGQGIIDILFDDFASCLLVKKARAVNWPDCRGSIGEYYAIADYAPQEREIYTNQLNDVLSFGDKEDQFAAIQEFLNLFGNGQYKISKYLIDVLNTSFHQSNQVIYSNQVPANERFSGWFYHDYQSSIEPNLYSITNNNINQERVTYYCDLIQTDIKPTIIVFEVCNMKTSEYSRSYVLDGHHKLEAYSKLKMNIPTISIVKLIESANETEEILKQVKPILKNFEYKHLAKNARE